MPASANRIRAHGGEGASFFSNCAHSFSWSADGTTCLLLEDDVDGNTRAYEGISAYSLRDRYLEGAEFAPNEVVDSAQFMPNRQILVSERLDNEMVELNVFDTATSRTYPSRSLGRAGVRDDGPFWANDGDLGALPTREEVTADIELKLFSLGRRRSESRIDAIPPDSEYRYVQFSPADEFLAYAKGIYPNYDAAYVDLRYDTVVDPKPVRVPGEGVIYSLAFGRDRSLYYVRERASRKGTGPGQPRRARRQLRGATVSPARRAS